MNRDVIITCAVTGAGDTVGKHPDIPVTPAQIAAAAIEAAKAGAAVAHIHVRDPRTGKVSHDTELFREVVERIRESDTDVVINITAGGGGDFVPSEDDATVGGAGTDMQTPEERHAPVAELLPEICSLDCGSYNFARRPGCAGMRSSYRTAASEQSWSASTSVTSGWRSSSSKKD
jgi:uncharacterized protein (DUF849 family)